jgi:hypothetical protein
MFSPRRFTSVRVVSDTVHDDLQIIIKTYNLSLQLTIYHDGDTLAVIC